MCYWHHHSYVYIKLILFIHNAVQFFPCCPLPFTCMTTYSFLSTFARFTSRDEENMGFVLRFCSTVLANTLAYQREMLLRKHNTALLEMARNLFSSVSAFIAFNHWCIFTFCVTYVFSMATHMHYLYMYHCHTVLVFVLHFSCR